MPSSPGQDPSALSFQFIVEIAAGETAKVDLCRVTAGPAEGRLVAVKRLHPHLATDPAFVAQFRDEMWMTAALRHPNVVEVVGWGSDDEGLYLAVELVQGVSLARLMKTIFDTGEAFTERMVVFLARQICRGLGTAHALRAPGGELLNLVHRDLTPGNVLCSFQGDVKIADFGLAKAKQRLTRTLTGMVKGQLEYISPEQATGNTVDARADIFSLGVMLFELFAGRRPWVAKNDMELARKLMTEPPADLAQLRPKIHRELVDIVNKCLEKDPAKRFQSGAELLARFDDWLSAHGYMDDNEEALGRFVRRNAMRQMAWFERVIAAGPNGPVPDLKKEKPRPPTFTGNSDTVAPARPAPADDEPPPTRRPGDKRAAAGEQGPAAPRAAPAPLRPTRGSPSNPPPAAGGPVRPNRVGPAVGAPPAARIPRAGPSEPPRAAPTRETSETSEGAVDWGEELPTLVKGTPEQLAVMRQAFKGKPFEPRANAGDARPSPPREAPPAPRPPMDSFATVVDARPAPTTRSAGMEADDAAESADDPTAPIGDLLQKVRAATGGKGMLPGQIAARGPVAPPGQIVAPDPSVPPPPVTTRSAGSAPPPPMQAHDAAGEERLQREAERLSIEAMRLAEEAKAAYARAERKAALAKATSDAATIASEALRLSRSQGIAEALRRLEVALTMERSARANEGAAGGAVSTPPPGFAGMAPPPLPPPSGVPAMAAPPLPAMTPPPTPVIPSPSVPAPALVPSVIPPAPPVPGRSVPPGAAGLEAGGGHRLSDRQAMPMAELDAEAFSTRLRPKVMGLPTPMLVAIGIGVVVVVVVFLVIGFG